MKTNTVATEVTPTLLPKAEAIEKISKHLANVRVQLTASKTQLQAAQSPDKYSLNFQVNALRKQANFWKGQIARIKKAPKDEINWSKDFAV